MSIAPLLALAEVAPAIFSLMRALMPDTKASAMGIAERVVTLAQQLTGQHDMDNVLSMLKDHPELVVQFQEAIMELEKEVVRAEIADRRHAREREMALFTAGHIHRRGDIMVIAAVVGLLLCVGTLVFYHHTLPGEAIGIISTVAGIFGACLKDAFAYEFGAARSTPGREVSHLNEF